MALNIDALKTEIVNAFNERAEKVSSAAAIDRIAEKLATAVVNHIKDNLEVTVQGTGNMGAPVISKSKPLGTIS